MNTQTVNLYNVYARNLLVGDRIVSPDGTPRTVESRHNDNPGTWVYFTDGESAHYFGYGVVKVYA